MSTFLLLISIFVLLLLSHLFSGAETALTSLTKIQKHNIKTSSSKNSAIFKLLDRKMDQVIATFVLGNTLVNILSSSLATALLIDMFGKEGILFATAIMTISILVFAEILPKTYAIYYPEKFASMTAPLTQAMVRILNPFVVCLQIIVSVILKALRFEQMEETHSIHDSIRGLISLHKNEKKMNDQEMEILHGVLDLADVEISQVMVHRKNVFTLDIDLGTQKLIELVLEKNHNNVPLWQGSHDNIVRVIDVRKLIKQMHLGKTVENIEDFTYKPWFVPDITPLNVQLSNFRKRKGRFALVVDEYGIYQGIITLVNIIEEIVGDIDYNSSDLPDIVKIGNKGFSIHGGATIRDINRQLKWSIVPTEHSSTLAGMLFNHAQRIPNLKEQFNIDGFKYVVEKKSNNTVERIHVFPSREDNSQ